MAEFTLDTGGEVIFPAINAMTGDPDPVHLSYRWSDLTPFQQGYVEAALRDFLAGSLGPLASGNIVGFSDLAPSALERILKDCEGRWPHVPHLKGAENQRDEGRAFWHFRNQGIIPGFPPLHVFLNDAGQVDLREAG